MKKENNEALEASETNDVSISDFLSLGSENTEVDSDEMYDVLFSDEDELFEDCDDIEDEEIFHEKEYFIPKNEV